MKTKTLDVVQNICTNLMYIIIVCIVLVKCNDCSEAKKTEIDELMSLNYPCYIQGKSINNVRILDSSEKLVVLNKDNYYGYLIYNNYIVGDYILKFKNIKNKIQ